MRPEDVPAEWVDALRDVIAPHMGCQDCGTGPGECPCRDAARAALAAVIPLVQKEEREACRREAVAVAHTFPQDDPRHETGWVVADAIRALPLPGGGEV